MEIEVRAYDHPDAQKLIDAIQQEYVVRYGGFDSTPVTPAEFGPPEGLFLVGYLSAVPVASGGWRVLDDGVEIKRMYVVPDARGHGFARRMLAALESTAAAAGHRRIVLETGLKQPEAVALYTSSGYTSIPSYGIHRCSPDSRCFEKRLG